MINIVIAIISGYILGSIPSAYLVARFRKGIDIREVGSKNMGTMNVYYQVGMWEAALVLLADVGKGIVAILLARWLGLSLIFQLLTGLAAVVGHAFPAFLKFRGGKGGATTLAILLFLMPKAIPFFIIAAVIALFVTRNLTFCYAIGFVIIPFVAWLIYDLKPLIFFSIGLPVFVGIQYAPRLKEMHARSAGNWRRVIKRSSLKERL
jgi:glycerol-3-phosphate acyltransferase PlsY